MINISNCPVCARCGVTTALAEMRERGYSATQLLLLLLLLTVSR